MATIIKYKWSFSELQIVITFEPLNRFKKTKHHCKYCQEIWSLVCTLRYFNTFSKKSLTLLLWYCWKICWNASCSCYDIVEKYVEMQIVLAMILLKNMLKCNLFLLWYCWKICWNATCSCHDIVEKYVEMQLVLAMILLKNMLKCNLFSPWYGWKIAHLVLNNNYSLYYSFNHYYTNYHVNV
jgi:hypothetical protein